MSPGFRCGTGLAHHQLDIGEFSQCFKHGKRHAEGNARIAAFEPRHGLTMNTASVFEVDERTLLHLARCTDPFAQAAKDVQYSA